VTGSNTVWSSSANDWVQTPVGEYQDTGHYETMYGGGASTTTTVTNRKVGNQDHSQTDQPIEQRLDEAYRSLTPEQQQTMKEEFKQHWHEIYSEQEVYNGDLTDTMHTAHRLGLAGRLGFWLLRNSNIYLTATDRAIKLFNVGKTLSIDNKIFDYHQKLDSLRIWDGGEIFDVNVKGPWRSFDWGPYVIKGKDSHRMTVDFYLFITDQVSRRPPSCALDNKCDY